MGADLLFLAEFVFRNIWRVRKMRQDVELLGKIFNKRALNRWFCALYMLFVAYCPSENKWLQDYINKCKNSVITNINCNFAPKE